MRNLLNRSRIKRLSRVPESGGFRTTQLYRPSRTEERRELPLCSGPFAFDEVLVVDARASLRPAQLVERKLMSLLDSVYLPVSHVRTTTLGNGRGHFSAPPRQPERKKNSSSSAEVRSDQESVAVAPLYCP